VFTEPQFSAKALDNIARQTGAKVLVLDPLGDPNAPDRGTYQQLMRYNLSTLLAGLQGPEAK
jgi:ABC-type Zn uptake system ZnuABC Zn-binding protein ZnuA